MDCKTFKEYIQEFSEADDKSELFDKYYHPDIVFIHPFKGTFTGKENLVNFWNSGKNSGHAGIKEKIEIKNILMEGNKIAAELLIKWHCFRDTDYLGSRKKGEVFYGNCAAFYELENNKFKKVQLYLNLSDRK
jgi:hypothetical protein